MKIEHIAIWTRNLEKMRLFYETLFEAKAGTKYVNPKRKFESYFLVFRDGARLELMTVFDLADPDISTSLNHCAGYAHMAISVGSQSAVDDLTYDIKKMGYQVISEPRFTGDGYYESVILDPDGNHVEITI